MTDLYAVESDKGLRWFVWLCGPSGWTYADSSFRSLEPAIERASALQHDAISVSICEGSALVLSRGPLA